MGRARFFVAVAVAGGILSFGGQASADCAAPSYELDDRKVRSGEKVRIAGEFWADRCNDTSGPCERPPDPEPIQDIKLQLRSRESGNLIDLTTVDADEDFEFDVVVRIPWLRPGLYQLIDERGEGYMPGPAIRVTRPHAPTWLSPRFRSAG